MKVTGDTWTDIDGGSVGVAIGDRVGGNYIELRPDGEVVLHGTAQVHDHRTVGAGSFQKGATAPSDGLVGITPTLDFSNIRTEFATYAVTVHDGLVTGSVIEPHIDWLHTLGHDPGKVTWAIDYVHHETGGSVAAAPTRLMGISIGNHLGGFEVRTAFPGGIVGGMPGEDLVLKLLRIHDNPSDNLGGDARMVNLHTHFLVWKLGESQ